MVTATVSPLPTKPFWLTPDDPRYPARLRARPGIDTLPLGLLGDPALLDIPLTALLCSQRCPGELILQAYDLARGWRDAGRAVVGGFHTSVERDALHFLLKGTQPVVICLARTLEGARLPKAWHIPLEEGCLLVVSACAASQRRTVASLAVERNRLVGALAERIVVVHASAGGRLEAACREFIAWGKPVFVLRHPANVHLVEMGATWEEDEITTGAG